MKQGGIAFFLFFIAALASSTTLDLLDLDQLTDAADVIVLGTVVSSESRWEKAHTDIGTLTVIRVSSFLKTNISKQARLTLHHPGGAPSPFQEKNWKMDVDGIPVFHKGQEGIFFLRKRGAYFELVGWAQGFFEITEDLNGTQIVYRDLDDTFLVDRGRQKIPSMTLNEFVSEVKKRVP